MVQVLIGDLFESEAQTLVNTVNCVGVMGKGVALEFKKRYPDMYKDYVARCKRGEVRLGRPYLYRYLTPPWVLNFPTKDHWRSVATLDEIINGLKYLLQHYKEWGITSLAVPPLGCGHGQLEWRIVGPTLYRYLSEFEIPVELYAPHGTPHEELQPVFLGHENLPDASLSKVPEPRWVKPGWVGLVEILRRIEDQPYHRAIGRTIFQKIAYVATEQGLPTELQFTKGSYGPFSRELKQHETRLANHGLIREERLGQMLAIKVGPTHQDARKAYADDLAQWDSIIEKTADLFLRINTSQAEVVAAALFAARALNTERERRPSERDVVDAVMDWKQRRRPPLCETEVASAVRNLAALDWLDVSPSHDLPLPEEMLVDR